VRVLVTGATGLVGSAVVRELVARGHAVRALARATSDLSNVEGTGAEVVRGDALDAASMRGAVAGCDAVVHTAGMPRLGASRQAFEVNVRGVEVVLSAALDAGVARAVLTSSSSVLGGTRRPEVMDESTPSNAESLGIAYFDSKVGGERVARTLAARGLPVVFVRPSFVLGPGDIHRSSASIVVGLARRRLRVYVEGGASFCDVRDVAAGHAAALERGRPGEAYVLGGHNLTISEMMARVCATAGVPRPRRIPVPAALALAAVDEARRWATRSRPGLTRELVRAAALYTFVSSAKAERELGYAIRPFDEMVRDTLRFAMATGRLRPETPELRTIANG
jgi:dihydroflavonol-4-reductase